MVTRHYTHPIALLLIVLSVFYTVTADAGLIRGGGRGTVSDSNANDFLLVSDNYVNTLGLAPDFVATEGRSHNSGEPGLLSTPRDCVRVFSSDQDREAEEMYNGWVEEPCYYEFYEQDLRLQMEGYGQVLFSSAFSMDIVWTISGNGLPDMVFNTGSSVIGDSILFDMAMPAGLTPGEYLIDLSVTFHSGPDHTFFSSFNSHDNDDVACEEQNGEVVCFRIGYGAGSDTLSFTSEYRERLVILEGAAPPRDIPAPAPLYLLLAGAAGLIVPRRARALSRSSARR